MTNWAGFWLAVGLVLSTALVVTCINGRVGWRAPNFVGLDCGKDRYPEWVAPEGRWTCVKYTEDK